MSWELALITGSVGLLFFYVQILKNLDETHMPLKFFMLLISMYTSLLTVQLIRGIAQENLVSPNSILSSLDILYYLAIWATIVVSSYMILYYLYLIIKFSMNWRQKRKDGY